MPSSPLTTAKVTGAIAALGVVSMVGLGASVLAYQAATDARGEVLQNRQNGYKSRALNCLDLVVDNDRYFDVPGPCAEPEVTVHYPPEVCDRVPELACAR